MIVVLWLTLAHIKLFLENCFLKEQVFVKVSEEFFGNVLN
jgi:hypothetical protein